MRVSEIVALLPNAGPLLGEYGLHCFGCPANTLETLEEGCRGHGFTDEDIHELVEDLNTLLREQPQRPQTLTITTDAARALRTVAEQEGHRGEDLLVAIDETGNFCIEFEKEPRLSLAFSNMEEPDVRVFATPLTLGRIGGATIDFRDGRFKLDLPEDKPQHSCGAHCVCARSMAQ